MHQTSLREAIGLLCFFKDLSDTDKELLESISYLKNYKSNHVLEYEEDNSETVMFLVDGLVKTYKIDKNENEIFLYYLHKDSLLSEISDIGGSSLVRYSNVETVEQSLVLKVNYKEFKKYFLDTNILIRGFTKEILNQSKQLQTLVNREFIFDSVSKVSMFLVSNLNMFNRLKRNDVSLMLHIQPATLSRVLNKLKRNSIIEVDQGEISILKREMLINIYRGTK